MSMTGYVTLFVCDKEKTSIFVFQADEIDAELNNVSIDVCNSKTRATPCVMHHRSLETGLPETELSSNWAMGTDGVSRVIFCGYYTSSSSYPWELICSSQRLFHEIDSSYSEFTDFGSLYKHSIIDVKDGKFYIYGISSYWGVFRSEFDPANNKLLSSTLIRSLDRNGVLVDIWEGVIPQVYNDVFGFLGRNLLDSYQYDSIMMPTYFQKTLTQHYVSYLFGP